MAKPVLPQCPAQGAGGAKSYTVRHISPVSYTHLDVYKRQNLDIPALMAAMKQSANAPTTACPAPEAYAAMMTQAPMTFVVTLSSRPVSYTHLDVYKRQSETLIISAQRIPSSNACRACAACGHKNGR